MLHPAPGCCLLELRPEKNTSGLAISVTNKQQILRGNVIAVGLPGTTKFGAQVQSPCKRGDVVFFLSYEQNGGYDSFTHLGKKYYVVEFLDIRVILGENKI
jgi:co-chaperonin GroES (HSP10)